jgi:hypothetical protein
LLNSNKQKKQVDHLKLFKKKMTKKFTNIELQKSQKGSSSLLPSQNSTEDILNKIEKIIDNKMDKIEKKIADLETKQSQTNEEVKVSVQSVVSKNKESITNASYAAVASQIKEIRQNTEGFYSTARTEMMENRNEELAEAREKKMREKNIVIHGKAESDEKVDEAFLQKLIKQIAVGSIKFKSFKRIGAMSDAKKRPILVQFYNTEVKYKVMNNLKNLKDVYLTDTDFSNLSVTDDYTSAERDIIKVFHQKAASLNENNTDQDYVYKVRGTPKNGMFLKKLRKLSA